MTSSLRPLRIRLVDPTQVGGLLAYLREHGCIAEQVDPVSIEVWPRPLLHGRNGDGTPDGELACACCGAAVEESLRRLGSPRCHDCRSTAPAGVALGAAVNGDARRRGRKALAELQMHLHAWRADAGAAAAILDD
jgi:hypothetical protein